MTLRIVALIVAGASCLVPSAGARTAPQRGLTAAPTVAHAYDLILDSNFDALKNVLPATCPPAPAVACRGLEALSLWWQIQLDLDDHSLDATFLSAANKAIDEAERWTIAEPERAEAWFYLGAAYGARAQYRVYRVERLAAARDGKRIKESLEKALALDPSMHDAEFGIGMYRYYAGVAPAIFKFLRFLLLLPEGDREGGLEQLERASTLGVLVRGEAKFQIQVLYFWYEHKSKDALAIVRELQNRYPHNFLFRQIEAEVLDKYFHDAPASVTASEQLLALARSGGVFRADVAERVARANIAKQTRAMAQLKHQLD